MAVRFCDRIAIYRNRGGIYDPFAAILPVQMETASDTDTINSVLVYEGCCKAEYKPRTVVKPETTVVIYFDSNDVDVEIRDTAYLYTNDNEQAQKLQVVDVMHYERNTIIHTVKIKDGENE